MPLFTRYHHLLPLHAVRDAVVLPVLLLLIRCSILRTFADTTVHDDGDRPYTCLPFVRYLLPVDLVVDRYSVRRCR